MKPILIFSVSAVPPGHSIRIMFLKNLDFVRHPASRMGVCPEIPLNRPLAQTKPHRPMVLRPLWTSWRHQRKCIAQVPRVEPQVHRSPTALSNPPPTVTRSVLPCRAAPAMMEARARTTEAAELELEGLGLPKVVLLAHLAG